MWAVTGRWRIGLLVSALRVGLYHIWPLNPAAVINLATPVTVVLSSFGMGLANGLIYRYRGFLAAVAVHGLGNWLLLLLLSSA